MSAAPTDPSAEASGAEGSALDLDALEAGLRPVVHNQLANARCSCGFDAYRISGIMIDYHQEIQDHMWWAGRQPTFRPLRRDVALALIAEVRAAREAAR